MSDVRRKEVRSTLSSRPAAARAVLRDDAMPPQELWFYTAPFALGAAVLARLGSPCARDLSEADVAEAFGDFA